MQGYNDRRRERRAAQRELEGAAAAMTGQCTGRTGCKCNVCDGRRREKRKADVRLSMQHARAKKAATGWGLDSSAAGISTMCTQLNAVCRI